MFSTDQVVKLQRAIPAGQWNNFHMTDALKNFVAERLAATGRQPFEAARIAGLERTFVRDILIGRKKSVLAANIPKLAVALDTTPEEIAAAMHGSGARGLARGDVIRADVKVPKDMSRDVPVLGTAAGSVIGRFEGFQLDRQKVIDHVRRPPGLAAAADAYAIYVEGDSMAPMHSAGELRFVHPHRPVRLGDTVIIIVRYGETKGEQAFIKLFRGRTQKSVIAAQLKPPATHQFANDTVIAVHRVLTMNELFEA
jgi:phage repressor protein C with HTH and peptisase S24 domain